MYNVSYRPKYFIGPNQCIIYYAIQFNVQFVFIIISLRK